MHLKMLSGIWRTFCLGLNVLMVDVWTTTYLHMKKGMMGNLIISHTLS